MAPSAFIWLIRCVKWMPGVAEREPRAPIVGVCPGTDDSALIPFLVPCADEAPDPGYCWRLLEATTCCCRFCDVTLDRLRLCDWFFWLDCLWTWSWFELRTQFLVCPKPVPIAVCVPPFLKASLFSRCC